MTFTVRWFPSGVDFDFKLYKEDYFNPCDTQVYKFATITEIRRFPGLFKITLINTCKKSIYVNYSVLVLLDYDADTTVNSNNIKWLFDSWHNKIILECKEKILSLKRLFKDRNITEDLERLTKEYHNLRF